MYGSIRRVSRRRHPDWLFVVAGSHDRNASKGSLARDEYEGVGCRSKNTKTYVSFGGIEHEKSVKSITKGVAL